jgi:hypothetical protein
LLPNRILMQNGIESIKFFALVVYDILSELFMLFIFFYIIINYLKNIINKLIFRILKDINND